MDMLSCIQGIAASSSLSFICQSQNHQQAHAWIVVKNDCFSNYFDKQQFKYCKKHFEYS